MDVYRHDVNATSFPEVVFKQALLICVAVVMCRSTAMSQTAQSYVEYGTCKRAVRCYRNTFVFERNIKFYFAVQ